MRIFIAIDLPELVKKELAKKLYKKILQKKHWKVAWVKPDKLHLTLAFLGELDKTQMPLLRSTIAKAIKNMAVFDISIKGLGCFPSYGYPQVIWLGLRGDLQQMAKMQKQIEVFLKRARFWFDKKAFSPHITIGRIKKTSSGERQEIGRQLKALRDLNFPIQIKISKIKIFESRLGKKGSKYLVLQEIKLDK